MRSPLNILYLSSNMPWQGGGTFYRAFGFARQLVQRGHRVTVMMTGLSNKRHFEYETADGVDIVSSPSVLTGKLRTGWDPYELGQRMSWMRSKPIDLLHTFETRPTVIYPALYAHRKHQPTLLFDWCDWLGRGGFIDERPPLTKAILGPVETYHEERFRLRAAGTTVINNPLRERAIGLGVDPTTIHYLPNGAETEKIKVYDRQKALAALDIPAGGPIVGYLGHALPRDAQLLADSFNLILQQRPDVRLLLIGDYRQRLAAYIENKDQLLESGFVQAEVLNQYLAISDVVWLPLSDTVANRGRWPMKLSDYMSAGRPVVSTRVGDWTRLFTDDLPIGALADPTPADIAAATLELLADTQQLESFGANARLRAETEFDWTLVTEQLEQFYWQTIDKVH